MRGVFPAAVTTAWVSFALGQQIIVDWSSVIRPLKTQASLQVVVNGDLPPRIIRCKSGQTYNIRRAYHARIASARSDFQEFVVVIDRAAVDTTRCGFAGLQALEADHVRFVPWLPYPRLGVAELEPPSGEALCGFRSDDSGAFPLTLACEGGTISKIDFASYGTPTGWCNSLKVGACNSPNSVSAVSAACLNKTSCVIAANNTFFGGDPCAGTAKSFAVQVQCSNPANHTYWDFTQLDELMEDFMAATEGHSVVINFSTAPQWLYQTPDRIPYPDDPNGLTWSYEQGTQLVDASAKTYGEYYGRLLAWYTEGGFTDEYGAYHASGHHYNISYWECLNEPEGEHGNSPQSYTVLYDSMIQHMKSAAPNGTRNMEFYGMALEGHREWDWWSYFLNSSNHQPGIPLDWASFHFYASCSSRLDPSTYTNFFANADDFIQEVGQIIPIRDALAPGVKLDVDEMGVILPDDNDPNAAQFPNIYWNAAGAMYAYLFGNLGLLGVDVLGESQLVGYPELPALNFAPQFPSVAMLNWTTGLGTARYWVLDMLIKNTEVGDQIMNTTVVPSLSNPFCGSIINLANLTLICTSGVISDIVFASYGTPTGSCPNWQIGACNDANSSAIVKSYCLGKASCTVPATTPIFGDPCYGTVKYLDVVASCSSGGGYSPQSTSVYAQAYIGTDGTKRVLVVNKADAGASITVSKSAGGYWLYVDESTGFGPARRVQLATDTFTINPFAVGFVIMPA